jgi:hypothetical protein
MLTLIEKYSLKYMDSINVKVSAINDRGESRISAANQFAPIV